MRILCVAAALLVMVAGIAYAQDVKHITLPGIQIKLAPGAGVEKVSTLCNICHSLDYITMQPPGTKAQWAAEVTKMRRVMGAPINDDDALLIIDYLAAHYGAAR